MKIAILSFGPSGMLHYALDLVNELSINNEVYLLTTEKSVQERFNILNCVICEFNPKQVFKIKNIIDDINPDLIHITAFHYSLFGLLLLIKKRRTIYTIHDAKPHPYSSILKNIKLHLLLNKFTQRFLFAHVSLTICLSSYVAGQIFMKYGISSKIIYLKNYGNKFLKSEPLDISEKINILCFGSLSLYKGLAFIEKFVSYLESQQEDKMRLIIAGKQSDCLYQKYSNSPLVYFINRYIDDSDISSLFSSVDYVLLPYTEVSQSGIMALAISFKKKCITPNLGSFNEYALAFPDIVKTVNDFTPENVYNCITNNTGISTLSEYENMYSLLLNKQ